MSRSCFSSYCAGRCRSFWISAMLPVCSEMSENPRNYCLERTTKVGSYGSNKLGLYDMHGNVMQWTSAADGASSYVHRGGSWIGIGDYCRAAFRLKSKPSVRFHDLGLRLVRVPSASAGK
ncbi:MAG TPA: SUMF1/EgtB/PvdO family nonheme iron enzyme [Gemmataceae bacterium]